MPTITYSIRSSSNPSNIYCRYVNTRAINITTSLNIFVNPKHWNQKHQKIKYTLETPLSDEVNKKLMLLRVHINDSYNLAFANGEVIDKFWLDKVIKTYFDRPTNEVKRKNLKHTVYYTDFAKWWMKEMSGDWLVGPHKYLSEREKGKYDRFIGMVDEFQGNSKVKLIDITNKEVSNFSEWLNKNGYSPSTIGRHISRFKFFCLRAEAEGFKINGAFKQRVYVPKATEIKEPYLDPNEIETIYNHNFTNNVKLDNVRDNLIIACWTGLRVSDFLRLDTSNFIDDFIHLKTKKTSTLVVIPVHPMVKKILIKRNGQFPKRISDAKFNEYIKDVCEDCKINTLILGKLFDKKKKRKIEGMYEKHKLVSSHIGRRSFATNLYGKIPNSVIMGVCGWSREEMMLHYIKKSKRDHAIELKKYWEDIYN